MSVYMTEEEQLEAIKKWWNRHSTVITTILCLVLLAVSAYKYYSWYQNKIQTQASVAFDQLMMAVSNQDNKAAQSFANNLIRDYKKTIYADAAMLSLAKINVTEENYDQALQQLQQVAGNAKVPALRQVAKLRIARIYKNQKAYDKGLETLSSVDDDAYIPLINELKGDIYAAKGQYKEAMTAYKEAMTEVRSRGMGNPFLEMKTNDIAALTKLDTIDTVNQQAA